MADMATTDAAFGLRPWGGMKTGACRMYSIVTSCAAGFYHGVLVENGGSSLITPHMGSLLQCVPEEHGAAGSLLGVVIALFDEDMTPCAYVATSEAGNSVIAGYALVCVDPYQEYIIQEDGDTSSLVAADIGLNADCIGVGGNTGTGISTMELDSSSKATTNTLAVKIVGVHPDDTLNIGAAAGTYCRFIVMLNSAAIAPNVAGA